MTMYFACWNYFNPHLQVVYHYNARYIKLKSLYARIHTRLDLYVQVADFITRNVLCYNRRK